MNIASIRGQVPLTQGELADLFDVTRRTLQRLESSGGEIEGPLYRLLQHLEWHPRYWRVPRPKLRAVSAAEARGVRDGLRLSQAEIASYFHVPLQTVRDWEGGKLRITGPARRLWIEFADDGSMIHWNGFLRGCVHDPRALFSQPAAVRYPHLYREE